MIERQLRNQRPQISTPQVTAKHWCRRNKTLDLRNRAFPASQFENNPSRITLFRENLRQVAIEAHQIRVQYSTRLSP